MYFKLSLRNVRRSIQEYTIYFLTLTFGVCIFYVFNSIESQQAMLNISSSQSEILKTLTSVMGYASFFIAFILGFLIIYANRFLIKRRKKEFGIYLTLGMDKRKISKILLIETITIGLASLVMGLTLGVILSQGLSVVTANMFKVDLKSFIFIFSSSALIKSILYFGIIFLLVTIFNSIVISKYKLIDLIYADKKNEDLKVNKLYLSVILFVISTICIGAAYHFIIKNGMLAIDLDFKKSLVFFCLGTFLFFMSLSGFLLKVIQCNKNIYLINLNMFVLRQINSKINTTYLTMSLICLMLFITIGTLSTGIGMSSVLNKNLSNSIPYDIVFYKDNVKNEGYQISNIEEELKKNNFYIHEYANNYANVIIHKTGLRYEELMADIDKIPAQVYLKIKDAPVPIIKQSQYNKLMKMQAKAPIQLQNNQFALSCHNSELMQNVLQYFLDCSGKVNISGFTYDSYSDSLLTEALETSQMNDYFGTIILPDNRVINMEIDTYLLYVNYKDSIVNCEEKVRMETDRIFDNPELKQLPFNFHIFKQEIYQENISMSITVAYLAIYVGIVFLITSAAILALQMLSEAADNIHRYSLLRRIGVEEEMINKSIFVQTAIYFMMPLSLAIVHSIVGIKVISNLIMLFGNLSIIVNIIVTSISIIIIYGGYFIATFMGSKKMIKNSR